VASQQARGSNRRQPTNAWWVFHRLIDGVGAAQSTRALPSEMPNLEEDLSFIFISWRWLFTLLGGG
jgi:hypothetical protein